jgi:hypothetical protein
MNQLCRINMLAARLASASAVCQRSLATKCSQLTFKQPPVAGIVSLHQLTLRRSLITNTTPSGNELNTYAKRSNFRPNHQRGSAGPGHFPVIFAIIAPDVLFSKSLG